MNHSRRALVCRALSDDLCGVAVESLPIAQPGPGEVLVRMRAAAVNFPDLLMTQGRYQFRPQLPYIPGIEGAGEVVAIGRDAAADPAAPRPGEPVLVHARTGAFAELACYPAAEVRPMPAALDFAHAAAFQSAAVTAYVALVRRAALQPGETLLVHGATGGVGMAAVQLGRHLGARVIATGTSPEKLARLRALEGVETLNLAGGLREQVLATTDGHGADVIFDPVGGDVFDASLRCIAWDGRLLVVGFASGRIPQLALNLPLIKGFSVVGVRAGEYGRRDPMRGAQNLMEVDRLAEQRVFRPHLFARYPLEQALDAMRALAERRVFGKVVIEMP